MSDANSSNSKPSFKEIVSILDRAWEAKWALQLVQLLLFLDLAMIFDGQPGMLGWDSATIPVLSNLSFVFVALVAFTVYAAFLTPFLSTIVAILIAYIPAVCSNTDTYRASDHVSLRDYRENAYELNDESMIARYHDREESNRAAEKQMRHVGNILFGTLLLMIVNAFPHLTMLDTTNTILQNAIDVVGWQSALTIALVIGLGMCSAMTRAWFYTADRWILHPKLYRELEAKRRKEQEEIRLAPYSR
ncbi:hypothetical protein [Vreelandella venusta]|uniref:hypothetical protein n=1 Tax=Vreelandella venusta TaxID=44935 RepID=UPI0020106CD4|nr:hypothetical protein [Halomonas venusta]UQI38822.1 hypothetical protein M3L73_11285 [Halomonas venusta]